MFEALLEQDNLWFTTVHFEWANPFLDTITPYIRNPYFWAPLYLFLLFYTTLNYKLKGLYWSLTYLATFGIADYVSASIIKPWVQRIRPCNDELFADIVRPLVQCGGGYSFPSSHATNHFAMALFICITLGRGKPWIWVLALLWAISIAFSQIYVGVHYPVDTIAGALLGIIIGVITATFFNKAVTFKPKEKKYQYKGTDIDDNPTFI